MINKRTLSVATVCCLWIVLLPVAKAGSPWRYWSMADGLTELVSSGVAVDSSGRAIISHLTAGKGDVLDGYRIETIPDMRTPTRLMSDSASHLWTLGEKGISEYDGTAWKSWMPSELGEFLKASPLEGRTYSHSQLHYYPMSNRPDMVVIDDRSALLLFPQRIVLADLTSHQTRTILTSETAGIGLFRGIAKGRDRSVWISGRDGVLRHLAGAPDSGWKRINPPGNYYDFLVTEGGAAGEALVTASRTGSQRSALRFDGIRWAEMYSGDENLWGAWFGQGDDVWLQDGDRLLKRTRAGVRKIESTDNLSGTLYDVANSADGSFWVANGQGLARYAPPLWSQPDGGLSAEDAVVSIQEDHRGRMWFLAKESLIENDHGIWSRRPLPRGYSVESSNAAGLQLLSNGDLAIAAMPVKCLLIFHPDSGSFSQVSIGEARVLGRIAPRRQGGIWVQTIDRNGNHWSIDAWENGRFLKTPISARIFSTDNVLSILDAADGSIWLGTLTNLYRADEQSVRRFDNKDGLPNGPFLSLAQISGGAILIGGRDELIRWDGKSFRVLHDGLGATFSISIGHAGQIWLATSSGIHRLQNGVVITNTADDGLPGTGARRVFEDSRGQLWSGTVAGIALFHPEADTDPPHTWIQSDQNALEAPPDGEVHLVFDAADRWKYTAPERLKFSWRLDGGPWSDFQSVRFTAYKHLRRGAHTFEVRSMDRNGNVDPAPAVWKLSVLAPWYMQKPFLAIAALAMAMLAVLIWRALQSLRKVVFASRHDPLTRLSNRAVFDVKLREAIVRATKDPAEVAVLMLDIDHFKSINDTLGHSVGDHFLTEVAARLRKCIRASDTLSRIGGDEFAIVMPDIPSRDVAEKTAKRIVDELARPYHIDTYELTSSASVGVSFYPEHTADADGLKRAADIAMYRCKGRGKSQYLVFDPKSSGTGFRAAEMALMLYEALDQGYFELHFQPLERGNGRLVAFEALVRMRHPVHGMIAPDEFIPVAEETGSIVPLGAWVLREACRQMAIWHAEGNPDLRISINISPVQLVRADFASTVVAILRDTGLEPSAVVLEVTESTIMRCWDKVLAHAKELRALGVSFALDDFGTGYSSLSALHMLPIDYLKIDQSFTRRMHQGENGLEVVEGIIRLAHTMGFQVVAEGVELAEQRLALCAADCDLLQGYLISRPQHPDQISITPRDSEYTGRTVAEETVDEFTAV